MIRVVGISHLDDLIGKVTRILTSQLGENLMAYHIGPAQFAFLSPQGVSAEDYRTFLEHLMAAMQNELEFQITMTPSIGSMVFTPGDFAPEEILRSLQSAAQDARETASKIAFFCPDMDMRHKRNFIIQHDFPQALEQEGQLSIVFQPRVDAASGEYKSAEVLLRWQHPTLGNISPAEFIPVIEASAYARRLTDWVISAALGQLAQWNAVGLKLKISINLSAINLQETDFLDRLNLSMIRHGVDGQQIEFELTETAVMMEAEAALGLLKQMTASGIRLSIDDFGTGYSSLAYLQKLPANVVKIDRTFINDMKDGNRERVLVQSMITLSHSLGYEVVAEGVETQEAAELLSAMGCDEIQGYWISRPLGSDALLGWLSERSLSEFRYREPVCA